VKDRLKSPVGRRFYHLTVGIVNDLGGQEALSTGQLQLARRCAQISVECEAMERRAAEGLPLDVVGYVALVGCLTRALRTLGLKREPRDVTPTLRDYLAARQQQVEASEEVEE
jgi:hypothetical protein